MTNVVNGPQDRAGTKPPPDGQPAHVIVVLQVPFSLTHSLKPFPLADGFPAAL